MSVADGARPGEVRLATDPASIHDATLAFVGRILSPWTDRGDCPRNMREARERGREAAVEIGEPYRPALSGLAPGGFAHLLSWLQGSRRDLALQMPRHADRPTGTFALRSPVRPNPIGLHLVRILAIDTASGVLRIDAIDALDGTPLLDIKPYLPSVDRPPET
ncbi:S-adenosylmethionine-dependent methyltransferase [Aureimonas flava]|uniref:S-adenosylmethionine-dependent methyltransferase n=1 Tax=Aureimonas flava TaxID=2320271 RepID=A0A3A1WPG7_9HYPH|nr:SAM-dependent methyltransferase [Aureimonas flava]RIY03798.1 S-adenosylmethionine-dependent methyltransferase [Aureimonas flava]